jgi:transcriptional regulator NrdR family protein
MNCPKCKSKGRTTHASPLISGIYKRKYECKACGHEYTTYEFNEADVKDILAERKIGSKYATNSLCWECKRATGFCSWSREFEPVKGWKAVPTTINSDSKGRTPVIESYEVKKCPLFEKDERSE